MTRETQKFIDETPLYQMLKVSPSVLRDCAVQGYELCRSKRFAEAEVIARGLVAADHRHWYFRSLLAVCLVALRRFAEARQVVDEGLRLCPGHRELVALRAALN
jgi:Flp pilus assembly protein TadD